MPPLEGLPAPSFPPVAEGIIRDLPFADYLKLPGLSASKLKKALASLRTYKWAKDHPEDDDASKPKALGSATHIAVLEPHRLATDIVVYEADRRGNAWKDFKAAHADKQILTAPEMELVCGMRDSVRSYPPAMRYLEKGIAEVTIAWIDPVTGVQMHGRIDWLTMIDGQFVLVDLKSTRDSSPRRFCADAFKLGYHIQFSLYVDGFFYITRETPRFVAIAVCSKPPFEPAVYAATDEFLLCGHEKYLDLTASILQCEETGIWPPALQEEYPLVLPDWAAKQEEDEDLSDLGLDLSE